jgi:ribulose-5-phosphate 4-epimerase/fuculose-1-phosphate aldolase
MPSGTPEFAELMVKTLADGWAAIMGQHGIVTCGPDLPRAYSTAVAVDDNARAYLLARQLGVEPTPIDAETCRLMHDQWLAHYRRAAAS